MRFRSYSMVAIFTVMLLLTGFALAQQPAAPATPESAPAAGQQETPPPATSNVQPPPEAPIEPVMSGPYPVMSKAAEDRGDQLGFLGDRTGHERHRGDCRRRTTVGDGPAGQSCV